ncbi:hypothetical protein [Nocardia bovistercoris]|nr:hypothetical protein [Nocardia bovistercoris]
MLERGRYVGHSAVIGNQILTVTDPFEISVAPAALSELGRGEVG